MSIKLGIYDFFAYTVPGGILLGALLFVLIQHFGLAIDLGNMSIIELLPLVTLAFLLGYANDYVAHRTWYRLFFLKNLVESTIQNLNQRNRTVEVLSQQLDLYICLSFIKKQNLDMAQEIEKINVQNIMLRSSSFSIFIFAVIFALEFFLSGHSRIYIVGSIFCLGISIILIRESTKFATWYVQAIYQCLVALVISPEQLPIKLKLRAKSPEKKQKD